MTEQELLIDCLRRLNASGIPYMLTGSMASNFWGVPRTTHDLDFVIQLSQSSAPALVAAFTPDFYLAEGSVLAALQPPYQFNAIDPRTGLKVDFWLLRPDPFEQEMFARRIGTELFNVWAWLATPEDVVLHKLYWNSITPSERQLGDAAGVVAVQRDALDLDYLRRRAKEMGVDATLEDLLSGAIRPKQT